MASRFLSVVVAFALSSACATVVQPRGALPPPPTDEQLVTDGSLAQMDALAHRYAVKVEDERTRVGDAVRASRHGVLGTDVNPELAGYVGADAGGAAPRAWMAATGGALATSGVVFLLLTMPIPLLVALGAVSTLEVLAQLGLRSPVTRPRGAQLAIFFAIQATLIVSGASAVILPPGIAAIGGGLLLVEHARRQAIHALEDHARRYNLDLFRRIRDLGARARAPEPVGAPP